MSGDAHRRERMAWTVALGALLLLLVGVQLRAGLMLTNDGPQRLYAAVVARDLEDASRGFAPFWQVRSTLTGRGFREIYAVASTWLDWRSAYRATLIATLVLWALAGVFAIAKLSAPSRGGAPPWFALVAVPAALQWCFYLGFLPFMLGTAAGVALCGWFAPRHASTATAGVLAAGVLFVAQLHLLAALCTVAACGVLTLRFGARGVPLLGVVSVPLAILLAFVGGEVGGGSVSWTWLPWGSRASQLVTHFLPTLVGAGVVIAVLAAALVGARRVRSARLPAAIGLCFVAGSLVLPYGGSWDLVSPRVLPWAFVFLAGAVPIDALQGRLRTFAIGATVLGSVVATLSALPFHGVLRAQSERLLAPVALGPGPRTDAVRATVVLLDGEAHPEVPSMDPALHVGQALGAAWGGFMHYTQAGFSSAHILAPTDHVERGTPIPPAAELVFAARAATDPAQRAALVDAIAAQGAALDEVIVLGDARDLALFKARGYVTRGEGAGWLVASAPKCDVRLAVDGLDAPRDVAVGVEGAYAPSRAFTVGAGAQSLTLALPCGALWLEVDGVQCGAGEPRARTVARPGEDAALACAARAP